MPHLLLRNASLLDVETGGVDDSDLLCADGRIQEVGSNLRVSGEHEEVDLCGATVLPGLIDAHVHVTSATADLAELSRWSPAFITAHSARIMGSMLERGFTTVRDASGADYGLADAQAEGLIRGPRVNFCGHGLSQTGGHGDLRPRGTNIVEDHPCCLGSDIVADGVDGVRVAARNELRKGANFLKVMAGGGVASPTDRVEATQYSVEELRAIVEEAEAANRYVAAHAYTPRAVSRALEAGVRSIEHGNLIDDDNVKEFLLHDAFLVPTLVTYWALKKEGPRFGLPKISAAKVDEVLNHGLGALERAYRADVKIAFGSDLLGGMHRHQSSEFRIRSEVQPPLEILRAATVVAAELLQMSGEIGTLRPGAMADLLVVQGNPVEDIEQVADPRNVRLVVQGGKIVHQPSQLATM